MNETYCLKSRKRKVDSTCSTVHIICTNFFCGPGYTKLEYLIFH